MSKQKKRSSMDKNTERQEPENNQNAAAEYADRVSDGIMGVMGSGSGEEDQKEESQPEQEKKEE